MRHRVFSGPFCCGAPVEPIRVRGPLRRDWIRRVRAGNSHSARPSTADSSFHAARESIFACLGHLRARAKLDLFAAALAELLIAGRLFPKDVLQEPALLIMCVACVSLTPCFSGLLSRSEQ